MTNIIMDFDRLNRCGVEEAVFCESKTPEQIVQIIKIAQQNTRPLLLTRLTPEKYQSLPNDYRRTLHYQADGWIAILGEPKVMRTSTRSVAIVSGGASDHRVCTEIAVTLNYHGIEVNQFEDVGVAALWRLNQHLEHITKSDIVITVAGMEAALPTVLSGLIANPIIAVPTSVGYGVAQGGRLALNACLGSCASGLTVVNIDNGFGAACAAIRLIKRFAS